MTARLVIWLVILSLAVSMAFCDVGSGSFWVLLVTFLIDGAIGAYLLRGFTAFDTDKDRKAMLERMADARLEIRAECRKQGKRAPMTVPGTL